MRKLFISALLFAHLVLSLTLPTSVHAQPSREAAVAREGAVDRTARPIPSNVAASPAPTSGGLDNDVVTVPVLVEPKDMANFIQILAVIAMSVKTAANLGTLTSILVAALAITYALMFLAKQGLKGNLPENYKTALRILLGVLTAIAAGIGYYLGGPPVAVAAGIGAAASGPAHDWLDAQRAAKKPELKPVPASLAEPRL